MKPHGLKEALSEKRESVPSISPRPALFIALLTALVLVAGCRTAAPGGAASAAPAPVYFAQITDTHHGPAIHQWRFDRAVDGINSAPFPISCVFHTGDFANNNLDQEEVAQAITNHLFRLRPRVLSVPGNHDITKHNAPEAVRSFERHIGPLATSFETNGVVFVALYTEPLRGGLPSLGVDYDPIAWLRATLRETHGKPVVLATHTPACDDFYNDTVHPGWPDEAREAWIDVLAEGNVVAVICGHFHRNEVHWDRRGIPTYVAPSIAGFWGRQASYRIYEFDPATGRLSYRTAYIEDPAP